MPGSLTWEKAQKQIKRMIGSKTIFFKSFIRRQRYFGLAKSLEKNLVNGNSSNFKGLRIADILSQIGRIPVYLLFKFILNA